MLTIGPRAFAISSPSAWKSLLVDHLDLGLSLMTFRQKLDKMQVHGGGCIEAAMGKSPPYRLTKLVSYPIFHILDQLNDVMRAAARLVLQLPRNSHIRSDMRNKLHWLDFPARSIFKLCVTAYRCQRGQAPTYLSEFIIPVSTIPGRSHL